MSITFSESPQQFGSYNGNDSDFDDDHKDYNAFFDDYDDDHDYDDDDECRDPFVVCKYCNVRVLSSRLIKHLNNKHKCNHCHDHECNYMNVETLKAHIDEKHMVLCKHCDAKKLTDDIVQHELTHSVVGMVQLQKLTDEHFNQLVAENRIYAKDGCLYVKESDRFSPDIQQNMMNTFSYFQT